MLEGSCRLAVDGGAPIVLQAGDFVLIPAVREFVKTSLEPPSSESSEDRPVAGPDGRYRLGAANASPDVLMLIGHCELRSPDAALLVSLLPRMVLVRGDGRLATLVRLVDDETRSARPARDVVVARLLEVLLIEALRATTAASPSPGLLRGLADERLGCAIRRLHERPTDPWTVVQLAQEAALSRSAFFERFRRVVGVSPMDYLLAWRMALAKDLLRRRDGDIGAIAARVGYGSASTFSTAFARHTGFSPSRYAREHGGTD